MDYGVVFGGASWEHEISIVSAIAIKKALKANLKFIFVDSLREFYLIEPNDMRANFFSSKKYKKCKKLYLKDGGFVTHSIFGVKSIGVDCYINLIHGCDGEDGKMAGLFEFYSLKFIGPRLEASVMSYSKVLTKFLALKCGVKTLDYEVITRNNKPNLSLPYILKPSHLGSSIGVSVVSSEDELEYALDVGFEFDNEILVEPFINGVREFNLAGFRAGSEFEFSIIEEPKKSKMLDFEQKYLSFSSSSSKEADISDKIKDKIKEAFKRIYIGGGFDGALIRCDFFVIDDEIYLNEINPNPGSLANYLFSDFTSSINLLANSIKVDKKIPVDYKYINSITKSKGKMA